MCSIIYIFVVFNTPEIALSIGTPHESLGPPMRAPRMWCVERDPKASLGSREVHGDIPVVVFWASSLVVVESPRAVVGHSCSINTTD